MEKKVASQIVSDTFNTSFQKEKFVYFVKNLLNHLEEAPFVYRGNYIPDAYSQYINTLERIGKYTDGENKIDVLIVNLKKETSIERARTMQRNFIAWYLNGSRGGELKDAALVAFVSPNQEDWRFSLVKMDYKFEETKDGKTKVKEVFTPARRWSFLVGKNENSHTAKSRLAPIVCDDEYNPTLKAIEDAFNIEKVTQEFFEKYRDLFLRVKESLDAMVKKDSFIKKDFEARGINSVDFVKKLLGQIVFLYFLQKKGWFGVKRDAQWGTGPKNFLRELLEGKHSGYDNFFNDILEPLFYEALARERDGSFYSRFHCKIPFLNGGLFDPLNNYDWVHTDIILPNELFSNDYKTKEGDIGSGILDIFDRYNFTVKEDEPLEKEVAVDPEMLGKVFENLLEVKDRKSKGTYYTPREIVHYMCEQSLLNYLSTELEGKVKKEDIEKLIKYGESVIESEIQTELKGKETKKYNYKLPESIRKNAELIDEKMANIKVCDPAVGSGAFPVGMMAEIVKVRQVLSAYIKDKNRTAYNFKRQCIQNSLYGVDLDPGAVEIAKLRLWLSLVVDEDNIENIKPLPNLDYKIMQGNSLLEEFEGIKLFNENLLESPIISTAMFEPDNQRIAALQTKLLEFYIKTPEWLKNKDAHRPQEVRNLEDQLRELLKKKKLVKDSSSEQKDLFASAIESRQIRDELEALHKKFFEETNKTQKDKLKQRVEKLEWELIEITLKEQKKVSLLKKVEELKKLNIRPFFLWRLNFAEVFKERGGFDVVIVNPPYVTTKHGKISESLKIAYSKNFETAYDKLDLYILFIEKAIRISKENGFTTFITPWNFLGNFYSFKIRKFLLDNTNIKLFSKLPPNVFSGIVVDNIISIFEKNKNNKGNQILFDDLLDENNKKYINQDIYSKNEKYIFTFPGNNLAEKILGKMQNNSLELGRITLNYIGIMTGGQKEMISDRPIFKNSKPVLGGKDIIKWKTFDKGNFVNFDKSKIHSNDNEEVYLSKKKILLRKTGQKFIACIDEKQFFTIQSLYNIVVKDKKYFEEYILSLLNSKLFTYIYNKFYITNPKVFPYIKRRNLDKFPVKIISEKEQRLFIEIVGRILAITKSNDYLESLEKQSKVEEYERQIDRIVYKLYDLTLEEIEIVENSSKK